MKALRSLLASRLAALPGAPKADELLFRDAPGLLEAPDHRSANRHCRMLRTSDGWIAFNLARPEDYDVLPALTGRQGAGWDQLATAARDHQATELRDRAIDLHLPVAVLGETTSYPLGPVGELKAPCRVLDMSALWAGPLCAGLLAHGGAQVVRIESLGRPDPTTVSSPHLDRRINGAKRRLALDLRLLADRERLLAEIEASDVLVTSARAPALARLGLTPDDLLAAHPNLCWVAITGHGFSGEMAMRVGFGDDCAVSGGLVRWCEDQPQFLGDALADPLTGLEAALAVAANFASGKWGLIDIAMARVAAGYAASLQSCG